VPIKVVIDTNIWVSSLLNPSGFPARLRKFFEEGTLHVIISEPILEEIAEVLDRPRIKDKYGISETDIKELLTLIEERSEHVLLSGNITICRDSDDNFVIETAIRGQAAFLITRDDDIKVLSLNKYYNFIVFY
jgi:putative PIN family toxin of toxin-antitoxin system